MYNSSANRTLRIIHTGIHGYFFLINLIQSTVSYTNLLLILNTSLSLKSMFFTRIQFPRQRYHNLSLYLCTIISIPYSPTLLFHISISFLLLCSVPLSPNLFWRLNATANARYMYYFDIIFSNPLNLLAYNSFPSAKWTWL